MKEKNKLEAKKLTTLSDLQLLVEKPMRCGFTIDGQTVEIEVKRLTPAVEDKVREILRRVQPPFKKDRGPHGDFDPLDPEYLKKRDAAEDTARAVTVYYCCPMVAAGKQLAGPGPTGEQEILNYVNSILPRNLQELIEMTAKSGGLRVEDVANFTLPPTLEN